MRSIDARAALVFLASRELGEHVYLWGGESTAEGGFDCSGWVSHCLTELSRAYPEIYDGGRRTAAGLEAFFGDRDCPMIVDVGDLRPGCLVFFMSAFSGSRVYHVKLHVANVPPIQANPAFGGAHLKLPVGPLAIDSGGGGSRTTTPREALKQGAGIRLSASDHHGGATWFARDPFHLLERSEK